MGPPRPGPLLNRPLGDNYSQRGKPSQANRGPKNQGRSLLRTSVAAFAAAISLGLWSEASNTILAHDIYSNLRDRDGHLCCGGQDCKPVEATVLPDGNYYLPATDEVISADMATPSPDDRFHRCIYYLLAPIGGPVYESAPKTRCFFASIHSS